MSVKKDKDGWLDGTKEEALSRFKKKFNDVEGLMEWADKKAHSDTRMFLMVVISFIQEECYLKGYEEGMSEGLIEGAKAREFVEQLKKTFS